MAKADYYNLLNVGRDADAATLKKAYRKMAMQFHPDRNPGDHAAEEKFKQVGEAYEVLSDGEKRAAYDQFGHAAFDGAAGGSGFDFNFADVFDDLFGEFMGGGRRQRQGGAARGSDLRYNLEIALEDAFLGAKTEIQVATSANCGECGGHGAAKGSKPGMCGTCNGHGKVRTKSGFFTIERTCPGCHGAGQVIVDPCRACHGSGRQTRDKALAVNIPAGVEDGTRIRLTGEGEAGLRGGPPGDLYIFITVKPHGLFERSGPDLFCQVPVTLVTAALGGDFRVPTLDGEQSKITIPAGTQSGRRFRLRGKGMPHLRGAGQGDLHIETMIETPVNLSKKQKQLLRDFDAAGDAKKTNPETAGFFKKVKELFTE